MRSRWMLALLAVSLAVNVTAGVALWRVHRTNASAARTGLAMPCAEERAIREDLSRHLCAGTPDRGAIRATLERLSTLRQRRLEEAVDRWLSTCCQANEPDRSRHHTQLDKHLCPWRSSGEGCCAPSPTDGADPTNPAQQTRDKA
ncbi:MAG: hypothetical protein AB2L07_06665 [Thermoanaerobaculaceae bacterium]